MDVVILSNGPGEITTWVKPVVAVLRQRFPASDDLRISVILSPCPNGTGKEGDIARQYAEVDRVQDERHFWSFLLRGKTADNWEWRDRGVVLFLGGDQIYPVIIGKRLGYKTVIYAEWFAHWPRWVDAFGVMGDRLIQQAPARFQHKFTVVGDLMSDGQALLADKDTTAQQLGLTPENELVGLLPGSKHAKLTQGMPLAIATADYIHRDRPQTRFVLPVAPTVTLPSLVEYADPHKNSFVEVFKATAVTLFEPESPDALPYLKTGQGTQIFLWQSFPAHEVMSQCHICLTTVGANTAELGALGIPMVVMLPTQQLDAMNAWDGLLGLIVNLPLVGRPLNKLINLIFLAYLQRSHKLFAWPNIWAKREIIPELLGRIDGIDLGNAILDYLKHPKKLQQVRQELQAVRGAPGAAQKLSDLVLQVGGLR